MLFFLLTSVLWRTETNLYLIEGSTIFYFHYHSQRPDGDAEIEGDAPRF